MVNMLSSLTRLVVRSSFLFTEERLGRLYHPDQKISLNQHLVYLSLTKKKNNQKSLLKSKQSPVSLLYTTLWE